MSILNLLHPTVKEYRNTIIIKGINGYYLQGVITKYYNTLRVGNNIFMVISRYGFTIHQFYLPDFVFILKSILNSPISDLQITNRRTISIVLKLLENETWIKPITNPTAPDKTLLKKFKWKPLDHQDRYLDTIYFNMEQYKLKGSLLSASVLF